ncbi:MAG: hypothetical protein ACOYES_01070 [Bacillota bacterium]|jgi:ABC-type sugar transport system ATPase subunit
MGSPVNRRAQELLGRFNVRVDARARVRQLTVVEQQIVVIAKALSQDSHVLIKDVRMEQLIEWTVDRELEEQFCKERVEIGP